MSMTLEEARRAAFDPIGSHATVTLDLAARVLADAPASGRDNAAYIQLAELKAELQRRGAAPTPPATFTVRGEGGIHTANAATGEVLKYEPNGADLSSIICFDVAEWCEAYPGESIAGGAWDILDFGFWLSDGSYEPAEFDWRDEIQRARNDA